MIELLAPAGDVKSAHVALLGGADAVYLGLTRFSARDSAENFDFGALAETATFAHLLGARVYVCLNTLVKDDETDAFFESARGAFNAGADALLVQDLFLGKRLKERYPELTLHLSTQGGCCNVRGARLCREFGFSRVVLARETPIGEIEAISSVIETEVFVQGALCTAFSGQCYFSSFAGNHSGNRGKCKQPCRKRYSIDRAGYEEFAYALSPSDLCLEKRLGELERAGVSSFKIEGRLRRPEYVLAAVTHYRSLLDGGTGCFSDLKRAYNRGDYTEGLAFGQPRGFLSRKTQGHIGETVGVLREGNFVKSEYPARKGDGFKILRNGTEVGGAAFLESGKGGFTISSSARLLAGDEVRLTTDVSLPERLKGEKKREIGLNLCFVAGEPARISCGEFVYLGEVLPAAATSPLKEKELADCFSKTNGLPFEVRFESIGTKNAFLPKSSLNRLRREFFGALLSHLAPLPAPLERREKEETVSPCEGKEVALIATDLAGLEADILIYKPQDYAQIRAEDVGKGKGKKYLYLPPFFTQKDEESIITALPLFCGVYCDGYYGLEFARAHKLEFFAGTGFNLTNRYAVGALREEGVRRFALSKELSAAEQRRLAGEGAFTLFFGAIKTMDLCYCPFERNCKTCDRRAFYTLTDEEGRRFPLRRYRAAGEKCRFEVYNCATLVSPKTGNALIDLTGKDELGRFVRSPEQAPVARPTKGHSERSML